MTTTVSGSKPIITPNPRTWYKKIEKLAKKGRSCGLMIVRLGGYERLNAILGYSGCMELFAQIYSVIRQAAPGAYVYRLSNLHFGCIITGGLDKAMDIAGQLENRLSGKFVIEGYKDGVIVPFSIIVADCPRQIRNATELEDMSRFVLEGTTGYYDEHIHVVSDKDLEWYKRRTDVEAAIERSIRNASFKILYQPIIRVSDMKTISAETLTRLEDEELGEVYPDEFIPLAEKLDVISYITESVMSRAVSLMTMGGLMKLGIERMHVNISATECKRGDGSGNLKRIVDDSGLDPYAMCLEISETSMPGNNNAIGEGITKFNEEGFAIVLDDYGTGFSNMTGIVALPIALVKIDKSFLWMAMKNDNIMVMLKDIINMIHDLDRKVLVTGIEDEQAFIAMKEAGIDYAQGFYFSKPIPEKELLEYVANVNQYGMSPVAEEQ